MLNIGLIGCGTHANAAVIPAMRDCGDFLTLAAAADVQQTNLDVVASQGVRTFADHQAMIDACDLDAVYIATLAGARERIALDAIAAGLHVMCEKPMASDSEACRRIVAAAGGAGRVVGVNFEMRFYDWVMQVNRWIAGDLLGRVEAVHVHEMWDGHKAFGPASARRRRLMDIAGALDCGIHRADLARLFAGGGNWQRIVAQGAWFDETCELPPHISVIASLDTRACVSLTSSLAYTAYVDAVAYLETFTIVGTSGIVHVMEGTDRTIHIELAARNLSRKLTQDAASHVQTIPRVLREFAARIEDKPHDNILATGEDGLAAQQFIERANADAVAHRLACIWPSSPLKKAGFDAGSTPGGGW